MTVRAASVDDIAAIGETSRAAGQQDAIDPDYVRLLLDTGTVRVVDGPSRSIAGWGAVRDTPLGSMLTDLFVHPDKHGQGIGGTLLRALWPDPDAGGRFTFSSRHASALPLYARAGLSAGWPLLYLRGSAAALAPSELTPRPVPSDLAAHAEAELIGGDRAADYRFWTRSGQGLTMLDGGRVVAVGVVRAVEVLHLVCADPAVSAAVVAAALRLCGTDASLCLPGPHPAVIPLLRAGFQVADYDIAMSTPDVSLPTIRAYSPALA